MEGGKRSGGSFTSDLFGSKKEAFSSSSSPSAIFALVNYANPWNKEGKNHSTLKETSSFYNEQSVQPCHLSSSIYYGGQDMYANPQTTSIYSGSQDIYANHQPTQRSGYSTFNKDGGEDDSGIASRGNWWQGGLYY